MISNACFCGAVLNVATKECAAGHPMTPAEVAALALRDENEILRALLEDCGDALSCRSCAEDSHCPDHGNMHQKIRVALDGSAQSESEGKDG